MLQGEEEEGRGRGGGKKRRGEEEEGGESGGGRKRKGGGRGGEEDADTMHSQSIPVSRAHNTTHIVPLTESGERSACTAGVSGTIGIGLGLGERSNHGLVHVAP